MLLTLLFLFIPVLISIFLSRFLIKVKNIESKLNAIVIYISSAFVLSWTFLIFGIYDIIALKLSHIFFNSRIPIMLAFLSVGVIQLILGFTLFNN